jgi:hypothetical protein
MSHDHPYEMRDFIVRHRDHGQLVGDATVADNGVRRQHPVPLSDRVHALGVAQRGH